MNPVRAEDHTSATANLARARRRYESLRLLLVVVLVLTVAGSLTLGVFQGRRLERLALENRAQAARVAELLRAQKHSDERNALDRERLTRALIADNRRALLVHDRNVRMYLSQIKALSRVEVYGARNQEARPVLVTTRFVGPIPSGTTRPTVTQPAPSPTCTARGKARCK